MTPEQRSERVKAIATAVGFDRAGVALPVAPPHVEFLPQWLDRGYAGQMDYLHRHLEIRLDPARLLPGARSVICVAMNYYQGDPPDGLDDPDEPRGRIARYAWGRDYHVLIRERLDALVTRLGEAVDEPFEARAFVDTAPVLERSLAAAAGLGWIGKNTMLIVPRLGSFVFLGGVVTTLALAPDRPLPDQCKRCRRCLDACPTGALVEPYVLDARRCISYLTIEHRQAIPDELRGAIGDRVFGCDACQHACPHNRRTPTLSEASLAGTPSASGVSLVKALGWDAERYVEATRGRATRRAKLAMHRRNAAVALGNQGRRDHLAALETVADGDDDLVAEHARWAIDQIRSRGH